MPVFLEVFREVKLINRKIIVYFKFSAGIGNKSRNIILYKNMLRHNKGTCQGYTEAPLLYLSRKQNYIVAFRVVVSFIDIFIHTIHYVSNTHFHIG